MPRKLKFWYMRSTQKLGRVELFVKDHEFIKMPCQNPDFWNVSHDNPSRGVWFSQTTTKKRKNIALEGKGE